MRKLLLTMALISIWQVGRAGEKNRDVPIKAVGITTMRTNVGGMDVNANIDSISIGGADARAALCAGSVHQCSGVKKIGILVNGRQIIIPVSVFSDLADLRVGRIVGSGKGAKLVLMGGNQSESYRVDIEFDDTRVISRTVSSLLEYDRPLERTVYYEVVID